MHSTCVLGYVVFLVACMFSWLQQRPALEQCVGFTGGGDNPHHSTAWEVKPPKQCVFLPRNPGHLLVAVKAIVLNRKRQLLPS